MTSGPREWAIGPHLFQFELPDILWVKYRGPVSLQEAVLMIEKVREVGAGQSFFLVNDMAESGLPTEEARRYFSEHLAFEPLLALIYLGGRLVHRATARGVLLAAYLTESTKDQQIPDKARFVSTLEEARALIVQLREEAAARQPTGERPGADPSLSIVRGPSW